MVAIIALVFTAPGRPRWLIEAGGHLVQTPLQIDVRLVVAQVSHGCSLGWSLRVCYRDRMVTLLALDLMDTVVRDPIFFDIPRLLNQTQEQVFRLLDGEAWLEFETGVIDEAAYLQRMFRQAPPPDVRGTELRDAILDGYCLVSGMEPLLDELRGRGHRLWILSNYSPWFEPLRARLRLDRLFHGHVVSYETGFRKPDPRAYEALLQRAGVHAHETLFIDDRPVNVEAAQKLGMQAVVFTDARALRAELEQRRLL